MAGDAINSLINMGLSGLDKANTAITGRDAPIPKLGMPSQEIERGLGAVLPKPETATERVFFDDVAPAVLGGSVTQTAGNAIKSAPGIVGKVGEALDASRGMQAVSGATSGAASGVTRELGGDVKAQLLAAILGGIAPTAAQLAVSSGTRAGIRGGEAGRQEYNDRLQTFQDAGVEPTAAQAAGTRRAEAVQSTMAKIPGSAGVLSAQAEKEAKQMGDKINAIADSIIPNADAAKAGRTVEKGLQNFVKRFKDEQNFLYEKVDAHIPKDTQVDVTSTRTAMADMNADIPGAPELSKWFKNSKIQGLEAALEKDTLGAPQVTGDINDKLPYEVQKMQGQRAAAKAGVELSFDPAQADLTRLYVLALETGMTPAVRGAIAEKASRLGQAFPVHYAKVGIVLDASESMAGTAEQKWRPLAVGLAMRDVLAASATNGAFVKTAGGVAVDGAEGFVKPSGATSLAAAVVEALRERPDALYVITDGYENAPAGRVDEVLRMARSIGVSTPVYQVTPVSGAEAAGIRRLSDEVAPMPVARPEAIGLGLVRAALTADVETGIAGLLAAARPQLQLAAAQAKGRR
jgi:hypothetical protein